jgi:hypothetical protein
MLYLIAITIKNKPTKNIGPILSRKHTYDIVRSLKNIYISPAMYTPHQLVSVIQTGITYEDLLK